jgi:hypothetical protein
VKGRGSIRDQINLLDLLSVFAVFVLHCDVAPNPACSCGVSLKMKGETPYLRRQAISASDMIFSFVRINTGFVSFGGYVVQRLSTSYPAERGFETSFVGLPWRDDRI